MSDGTACGRCGAERAGGFICRPCTVLLERAIGDMTSLLHEVSLAAMCQTNVYRAAPKPVGPDEELAELEEEYGHRLARIPAWLRSRDSRVTLPATPSVVNFDATDLLYDAYHTLLTWACELGADEISSRDVVPWLLRNINEARHNENAAQIVDEITYLHSRMTSAVDRSPSRIYAGPCTNDDCRQQTPDGTMVPTDIYAPWGPAGINDDDADKHNDREFTCDGHLTNGVGCGTTYTWAARRPWLIATIQTSLVTIDDMLAALPDLFPELHVPRRDTVQAWVRNNRIFARGRSHVGEDTFLGSELLERISKHTPHAYAPRKKRNVA